MTLPVFSPSPSLSDFLPIICVCASKQAQVNTGGFAYIQGSGDDHELWSMVCVRDNLRYETDESLKKGPNPAYILEVSC